MAFMERPNRPSRNVAIADHIWEAFEEMARAMGSDRDGLINQALFMFARLNGFIETPRASQKEEPRAVASPSPAPPPLGSGGFGDRATPRAPMSAPVAPPLPRAQDRGVARFDQGSDMAAELDRLMKSQPPVQEMEPPRKPEAIDFGSSRDPIPDAEDAVQEADDAGEGGLFLESELGEQRVDKDRFVIGRGKHCDFVINSGKVSREHAAVSREGDDWYIEDLGSSNGTYFNKQRIKRRKIEDGDEYFVCSERIRFALR
jgi:hypothetical protein